jgi:hypothetical protein
MHLASSLRHKALIPLLCLAAACRDEPGPDPEVGVPIDSGATPEYTAPALTPAESIAAVRRIQAQGDSLTRVIKANDPTPPRRTPPARELSPQEEYRNCLANAEMAIGPTKPDIQRACTSRLQARTQTP